MITMNVHRKLLVNDTPTVEDLEGIDYTLVQSLNDYREVEKKGITSETFSDSFFETFTTTSSDDRIVELVPGGDEIRVTFENRNDYCDKVTQVCIIVSVCSYKIYLYLIL